LDPPHAGVGGSNFVVLSITAMRSACYDFSRRGAAASRGQPMECSRLLASHQQGWFMKKFVAVLALSLAFSPAHAGFKDFLSHRSGTEITQEQLDSLKVGKSKKADVIEVVGQPGRKEQLGDHQVWYYDFSVIRSFGKNVNESTVFEFNKAGVLVDKYKTGSGKAGNPLQEAAAGK